MRETRVFLPDWTTMAGIANVPPTDEHILYPLRRQNSRWSLVRLTAGRELRVFNISWSYDLGDSHAYVSSNNGPDIEGASVDYFHTHDIAEIIDEETGRVVYTGS